MFTWICPKCGNEVPPSYSECPRCADSQEQTPEPPAQAPAPEPAAAVYQAPPPVPQPTMQAAPQQVLPQAPARPPAPAGVRLPGWAMSLLFAATFIILGLTLLLVFRQPGKDPATAAAPMQTPPPSAPAIQPIAEFKNIELTGLRLTEDAKQKPFVQCVVVNHSGADLGDLSAHVDLKAVTSKDQETVGSFTFNASLGPYESKDVRAPLTTKLRIYELPDWQFLRAEITGK